MSAHQLDYPISMISFHTRPPDAEYEVITAKSVAMRFNLLNNVIDVAQDKSVFCEFLKRDAK